MRKPRAIVCDDNDVILDVCRNILEEMDYEVVTANTPVTCAFFMVHAEPHRIECFAYPYHQSRSPYPLTLYYLLVIILLRYGNFSFLL